MAFRICTIGCGNMATAAHGPSYAKYAAEHPDTELAACCDLDPVKVEAFQEQFGFARRYTDLDAMLDSEQPNAVCLVAPVELTCDLACRILAKGFPLLMEKPPGQDIAEIDRMIAAADVGGAPTQVAFNRRYTPLLGELKRLLHNSLSPGAVQHLRCDFPRTRRPDPDFSTTAIHGIDAVRFLAERDYQRVRFHYQPLPQYGPTVVNCFLDCTLESGATAHLSFCPMAGEVAERYTVYAEDNTFSLHLPIWNSLDAPGRLRHVEKNTLRLDVPCAIAAADGAMFETNGFYAENVAFFDAIRSGARPLGDLRNARQSVEVAQAMRERRPDYHKA